MRPSVVRYVNSIVSGRKIRKLELALISARYRNDFRSARASRNDDNVGNVVSPLH